MTAHRVFRGRRQLSGLIIKVARCELIWRADREDSHPCHVVVGAQNGTGEYDRQVPEAWAGNLHSYQLVFLSSNPSISEPGSGQPLDSAEDYPRASSTDHTIIEFQGRRFDQTLSAPFVKNGRYLQQNGHYTHSPIKFWTSVQRRAEELLGPIADPSVNYVMTEVVHCKSKNEAGVSKAGGTCAKRYLNDILALTNAPIVAVVGEEEVARLPQRCTGPRTARTAVHHVKRSRRHESAFRVHMAPGRLQGPKDNRRTPRR